MVLISNTFALCNNKFQYFNYLISVSDYIYLLKIYKYSAIKSKVAQLQSHTFLKDKSKHETAKMLKIIDKTLKRQKDLIVNNAYTTIFSDLNESKYLRRYFC